MLRVVYAKRILRVAYSTPHLYYASTFIHFAFTEALHFAHTSFRSYYASRVLRFAYTTLRLCYASLVLRFAYTTRRLYYASRILRFAYTTLVPPHRISSALAKAEQSQDSPARWGEEIYPLRWRRWTGQYRGRERAGRLPPPPRSRSLIPEKVHI